MLFNGVSGKHKQFIKKPNTYNSNQYILYKSHDNLPQLYIYFKKCPWPINPILFNLIHHW